MTPQSPSIQLLPPPGPSVLLLSTDGAFSPQGQGTSTVAQLFLAARKVRFEVFVIEQHCSAANEIDIDDATSWHWVIYAPPSLPLNGRPRAWLEPSLLVGKAAAEGGGQEGAHHLNNDKNDNDIINNNNKINDEESARSLIPVATIRLVPFSPSPPTAAPPASGEGEAAAEQKQQQQLPTHTATKIWNGKEAYIKLGRLATLRSHRGLGFGRVLIDNALKWAVENASTLRRQPCVTGEGQQEGQQEKEKEKKEGNGWNGLVLVHAQRNVEAWYRSVQGFVTDEGMGVWMEEGIEHVGMWRRLDL